MQRPGRGLRCAVGVVLLVGLLRGGAAAAAPGLTSAQELAALRAAAEDGSAPEAELRDRMLEEARRPWRWGSVSGEFVTSGALGAKTCHPESDPGAIGYLKEGAPDAYAEVLGAHLAGDDSLAALARSHVVDLLDTRSFRGLDGDYSGGNQCILELALSTPIWIETAKLLEDTPVWTSADRDAFQSWLAGEVYPRVAWASRVRSNNWGSAGSLAAWAIATYVEGDVADLRETRPAPRISSPREAATAHAALQLQRLGGAFSGDARCPQLGIQSHGGIPEELRRGTTGCAGTYLVSDDASLAYQTMHVELLVLHAELLRAQGDRSLYDAESAPGAPAILQAIRFVIDNPTPGGTSWPWPGARIGTLVVAATFYDDPALAEAARGGDTFRGGRTLPYAGVTHGDWRKEVSATPPPPEIGRPGKPEYVP